MEEEEEGQKEEEEEEEEEEALEEEEGYVESTLLISGLSVKLAQFIRGAANLPPQTAGTWCPLPAAPSSPISAGDRVSLACGPTGDIPCGDCGQWCGKEKRPRGHI